MKKLISQTGESCRLAILFCLAAFPLFCIPLFFEGLQHIAEVWLGMFSAGAAENFSAEDQNIRLVFGVLKVLSLIAIFVLVPRYFIHGQSVESTLSFSNDAKRAALIGVASTIFFGIMIFFIGPIVVDLIIDGATDQQKMLYPFLVFLLISFPLYTKMNGWMAGVFDDAPLRKGENKVLNKALKGGFSPVFLLCFFPMLVVHYALNFWAMEQPMALIVTLLGLDSLVVGVLAVLMATSTYVVYRDARRSITLSSAVRS